MRFLFNYLLLFSSKALANSIVTDGFSKTSEKRMKILERV